MPDQITINLTDSIPPINQATIDLNGNTGNTYSKEQLDTKMVDYANTSFVGIATSATVPIITLPDQTVSYKILAPQILTNFLDINSDPIEVIATDFENNGEFFEVYIYVSDGVATKVSSKKSQGDSAYQLALKNGFVGTEAEYLISLKGASNIPNWIPDDYPAFAMTVKNDQIWQSQEIALDTDVPGVSSKWKSLGSDDEDVRIALKWFLEQQSGGTEVLDYQWQIGTQGNIYNSAEEYGFLLNKDNTTEAFLSTGVYPSVYRNINTKANGITKLVAEITVYGNNPSNPMKANVVGIKNGIKTPLVLNIVSPPPTNIQTFELDISDYDQISIGFAVIDSNPNTQNIKFKFYKISGAIPLENSVKNYIDENGGGMRNVIDLIDFGCKGDGVTDDTIKFNEAIVLAMATGKSIYGRSNKYKVTSLSVPFTATWKKVEIFGDSMPIPTFGTIGSIPTYAQLQLGMKIISTHQDINRGIVHVESGGGQWYANFSNVFLVVRNCVVSSYSNPQISGVNAENAVQCHFENLVVDTNVYNVWTGEPTHNTYGVIPPTHDNSAYSIMRNVVISGYKCNLVGFEHLDADNINLCGSKEALRLAFGSHAMRFGRIGFYRNAVDINITGGCAFSIEQMNCEYVGSNQSDSTNAWQKTQYELNDPNSLGIGRIVYSNTRGASGKNNVFRMNGATNVLVKYINSDVRITGVGVPDPNPIV